MKRLIVNADDLGRTFGINLGVIQAHRNGIVSSSTLMVNYPAAHEVPKLVAEETKLGIGLHVALTGGQPTLPPAVVPSLMHSGKLADKADGLAGADPGEVLAEVRAQLEAFRQIMGRAPTHLDSHHHSHRTPAVLEAIVNVAREAGLPVRAASPAIAARLRQDGIRTTDHFVEEFFGDGATLETLERIIEHLPDGTTEVMCHPAVVDEELRASSSYADARDLELSVLTHPRLQQTLRSNGVQLIHFGEL